VTESKLVPIDALVNKAVQDEAFGDERPVSATQALAEMQSFLQRPGSVASDLIPEQSVRPPKKRTVDVRAPDTLNRAALSLLAKSPEEAVAQAMSRAGLTREMIPQLMESPDWAGAVARLCQQYLYVTHLPQIVSAQITKASLGDTAASKHLAEMFGRSDLESLDEQTRAMSEADPETVRRYTKGLIEDLQRMVDEQEGAGANQEALEAARSKAISQAQARLPRPR